MDGADLGVCADLRSGACGMWWEGGRRGQQGVVRAQEGGQARRVLDVCRVLEQLGGRLWGRWHLGSGCRRACGSGPRLRDGAGPWLEPAALCQHIWV